MHRRNIFLALSLLSIGCDAPKNDPTARDGDAGPAIDALLDEAPAEPEALLKWAGDILRRRPPAVDAPENPVRAQLRWPVIHLEEYFEGENVVSPYQSKDVNEQALIERGPFRSNKRENGFRPQTTRGAGGARMSMGCSGLAIECDQVGRIGLRIRVPVGKFIEIAWSQAGSIRLPVATNDEFLPLSITTDGLAEWNGTLDRLVIEVEDPGAEVVEIDYLRLFRRTDAYPRASGVRRVDLSKQIRTAVYMHTPCEVEFPGLIVPENARLQVGLGVIRAENAATDKPASFDVVVRAGDRQTTVLTQEVSTADRWVDFGASLSEWAGKEITIVLKARDPNPDTILLWGDPEVYQPVEDPPIAILYLIDTLSAKHLQLYGYDRETNPNIAAFAANGAWFANAYCNSPVTVASVKDMLLSMPATRHGVYSYSLMAPRHLIPLPEALRHAGIATVLFSTNVNAGPAQQTDRGCDTFFDRIAYTWSVDADRTVPIPEAIDWIQRHRDRAMFLYVHTAEPHAPYEAPAEFQGIFEGGGTEESSERTTKYDEEVAYADHRFGAFMAALEAIGMRARAHVFLVADHGEEIGEHGNYGHGHGMYNEVMRIPMIAAGPKITRRGEIRRPSQLFDVMPTLLDLFELPAPYEMTGASLMPILTGADAGESTTGHIVSSFHEKRGQGLIEWTIVGDARWKLMFVEDPDRVQQDTPFAAGEEAGKKLLPAKFELYDLQSDPGEKNDILRQKPKIVRKLALELVRYVQENPRYRKSEKAGDMQFSVDQLEQLRDLGYVD